MNKQEIAETKGMTFEQFAKYAYDSLLQSKLSVYQIDYEGICVNIYPDSNLKNIQKIYDLECKIKELQRPRDSRLDWM